MSDQDYEANQDFYENVDGQEEENDQNYSDNEQDTHDHLAFDQIVVPDIKFSKETNESHQMSSAAENQFFSSGLDLGFQGAQKRLSSEETDPIYIQDDLSNSKTATAKKIPVKDPKVAQFEIFESSSDDELSQCAFESAAESFQKREKGEVETSKEKELKMKDKQRRQERKKLEKLKKKRDQEKEKKKEMRQAEKRKLAQNATDYFDDELHEDLLNFRDSDRESLASLLA